MDKRTRNRIDRGCAQLRNNLLLLAAHGDGAWALHLMETWEALSQEVNKSRSVPIAEASAGGGPCPHVCRDGEILDLDTGACVEC
jgi:hypothetical protein